jgi:hypothetical protein
MTMVSNQQSACRVFEALSIWSGGGSVKRRRHRNAESSASLRQGNPQRTVTANHNTAPAVVTTTVSTGREARGGSAGQERDTATGQSSHV